LKQDLVTILDLSKPLALAVLDLAATMKAARGTDQFRSVLAGKSIATVYEKPSTRTKISFAVGIYELGANCVELTSAGSQLSRGETYADTGRILSRYCHGIVFRSLKHSAVVEMAQAATVPVINSLSDMYHPCQILGDLLTVQEHCGDLSQAKIAFIGNGSNIVHSLMNATALLGLRLRVATPPTAMPLDEVKATVAPIARESGACIEYGTDPIAAATGADVVYTDVWFDMGKEANADKRRHEYAPYQVNGALMAHANPSAIVLHCLPANRGQEITDEIMDGPQSAILDQAENRLHIQKAIMAKLFA
jgi:ornithine carbamoyltransferase